MVEATEVPNFYQYLSTMGIGGILAGFAIWMLNKAWKDHADYVKGHVELERTRNEVEKDRTNLLINTINENTKQTTVNTTVLGSLHRRLDREEYEKSQGK